MGTWVWGWLRQILPQSRHGRPFALRVEAGVSVLVWIKGSELWKPSAPGFNNSDPLI